MNVQQVKLDKMFLSKPSSLALEPSSPGWIEEPKYQGLKHVFLKMMLFYSKQSRSIRGAHAIYSRVTSQVDSPAIYEGDHFSYIHILLDHIIEFPSIIMICCDL